MGLFDRFHRKRPTRIMYKHSVGENGVQNITVFAPGKFQFTATDDHPNFLLILDAARNGDPDVENLWNVANTVDMKFRRLTDHVTVRDDQIFWDDTPVDDALTQQVLQFCKQGTDDWRPLVKFWERLHENPNDHSRKQLFGWLRAADFTITEGGLIVGYKGVNRVNGSPWAFESTKSGHGFVNGVEYKNSRLPNPVGAIVEMPRNEVVHDPSNACSAGLHVGTWNHAKSFGNARIEVRVDPGDVVSVPSSDRSKMRVCRFRVIGERHAPYSEAIIPDIPETSQAS